MLFVVLQDKIQSARLSARAIFPRKEKGEEVQVGSQKRVGIAPSVHRAELL